MEFVKKVHPNFTPGSSRKTSVHELEIQEVGTPQPQFSKASVPDDTNLQRSTKVRYHEQSVVPNCQISSGQDPSPHAAQRLSTSPTPGHVHHNTGRSRDIAAGSCSICYLWLAQGRKVSEKSETGCRCAGRERLQESRACQMRETT